MVDFQSLLDAGAHFGHLKRKWNPAMAPYIFPMEKNDIHIIDLHKTVAKVNEAAAAMKQIAKSGKQILFVATKKQAKQVVADLATEANMPYITERWAGGMLTNFQTIHKAIKKMDQIEKKSQDGTFNALSKREKLQIQRQSEKLQKNLGSIKDLKKLPAAIFVVDVTKEHIAVAEAKRCNIPVFAIVDTNSDPKGIDFLIPANDDATKSVELIVREMVEAIKEGAQERKLEREENEKTEQPEVKAARSGARKGARKPKAEGEAEAETEAPAAE
ncbi:MAG: 30S ribosomal protein S2 [Paludibacteraceae bacterium]|nr:30S ribosomal protein S2 [Paludibacteraceae bacterium]